MFIVGEFIQKSTHPVEVTVLTLNEMFLLVLAVAILSLVAVAIGEYVWGGRDDY